MITESAGCDCAGSMKTPEHTFDVFFYGLNMDADLLTSKGVVPRDPRVALIEDHVVILGAKAMLQRSHGGRAYGMLFRLTHREMGTLYADLHDYSPEPFTAILVNADEGARPVAAISMVHRDPPVDSNHDPAYCARWKDLVRQLGFPESA
ncbi:conserved hypothetical protein [Burkholderia sp. H160]|nr:conserved hypothetical protein [Burkholderia sp. H160]